MERSNKKSQLDDAKRAKKDEFYTQLKIIEAEMVHYEKHFKGKVVYCNCDDPLRSQFARYFYSNFERLRLKRLIASCHKNSTLFTGDSNSKAQFAIYEGGGGGIEAYDLKGDGDFRSPECVEFLQQADIVVTNPPFSLFREYVAQLYKYRKKFIIIGNVNAICYKSIFAYIKRNELWLGASIHGGDREFEMPKDYPITAKKSRIDGQGRKYICLSGVRWFTNLDHASRYETLLFTKMYSEKEYPRYDNADAIEVSRTKNIPIDYEDAMGVPITFLDKYNPEQFEILGQHWDYTQNGRGLSVNGKDVYARIIIQRRHKAQSV